MVMNGWSTPRPGRFTTGNDPLPFVQKAVWAPGPVSAAWTISSPLESDLLTVQSVTSPYTDSATHKYGDKYSHLLTVLCRTDNYGTNLKL